MKLSDATRNRLPAKLFDFHVHLASTDHLDPIPQSYRSGDDEASEAGSPGDPQSKGLTELRKYYELMVGPGRLRGSLCMGFPTKHGDPESANAYVSDEIRESPIDYMNLLVTPDMRKEEVERLLDSAKVKGFKPYHCYAPFPETFDCDIDDFLPEWSWELADEYGLLITLHLVKQRALSDPSNIRYIRDRCERFPNANLVLAHAGRGFNARNTVDGIGEYRYLENLWFDTAAICEAAPIVSIIDAFGPRRLLWGSDYPVSTFRGRCVSMGTGFAWITSDLFDLDGPAFHGDPITVGEESIAALFVAIDDVGLDEDDTTDIFHDNALRLLGAMPDAQSTDLTQDLYDRAKDRIPGGTQLLSKRPEMFAPGKWPAYFREARGCEVWDVDGRHFYDVSIHGIGASLLGYRDADVTRAVQRRLRLGSFSTLNAPEEAALADVLCDIHPWADCVRYARTGGEAMSIAVRIARATTDRSIVLVCGYHGWHDWYLAANLGEDDALRGLLLPGLDPTGVPRELRGTTLTFEQNDTERFDSLVAEHGDRIACVVMEPCRGKDPAPGFLDHIKKHTHRVGAMLVFDEITIGWRLILGGAHRRLNVNPDIAVFAKSLGNGHPMAAIIGTRDAMEGAHTSFISSTNWTESVGPVAALATIEKMKRIDVPKHCHQIGTLVMDAWRKLGADYNLPVHVPELYPALAHFEFEGDQAQQLKTLYSQLMLDRGFLATTAMYMSLAHTQEVVEKYIKAICDVFDELAKVIANEAIETSLEGPVAHTGFRRLL